MSADEGGAAKHPMRGLLVTQFFGSFNDNAWKTVVFLLGMNVAAATLQGADLEQANIQYTALSFVALSVALFVFSIPAANVADRFSKRNIIVTLKLAELALMLVGLASLWVAPQNLTVPFIVLVGMGAQSAFFSPAKYGILPQLVPHRDLAFANGLLALFTITAIVGGTVVMGSVVPGIGIVDGRWDGPLWFAGGLLAVCSAIGLGAALAIPRVPPAGSAIGVRESLRQAWQEVSEKRVLRLTIFGLAFYWAIASFLGPVAIVKGQALIESALSPDAPNWMRNSGILLACFACGVGGGSVLAGKISAGKVEYGLIPLGAFGMSVFILGMGVVQPGLGGAALMMALIGGCSGFVLVPLNALLQWQASDSHRGSVIALSNLFTFGGTIVGTLVGLGLGRFFHVGTDGLFVAATVLTAGGTVWAMRLMPDAFLRLVLVVITHTLYRVRVIGARNVPAEGGALLVPNHVSFVDGLFLITAIDRPIRFIVDESYVQHRFYGPFLRAMNAIPISSSGGPRVVLREMRDAGVHLDDGHLLCIFGEGQITRTGQLRPFRRGLERIVKGRDAPVIPVNLAGVWGSVFSRAGRGFLKRLPRRIPYPVTVAFGAPLPTSAPMHAVRNAVQELGAVAWTARDRTEKVLHYGFMRAARPYLRHGTVLGASVGGVGGLLAWSSSATFLPLLLGPIIGVAAGVLGAHALGAPTRLAFADLRRTKVGRLGGLIGVIALALELRREWKDQERIGVMLPPTIAGAFLNLSAALSGRTSVNLNYTIGRAGLESAARQSGLETVISSRAFLEKANVEIPDGITAIWAEDVGARIGFGRRLQATLLTLFAPARFIERLCTGGKRTTGNDIATVIFSSGSTGEPKGILLSHANVAANLEAVAQVLGIERNERLLGILPHFHSFGYLALWLCANEQVGCILLPSPIDAEQVGQKVQQYRITMLVATPTFLQIYLRRCTPAQFGSLRFVLASAEKLTPRLAQAFEDHFGIRPLEAYGASECAPGIALSTLDYRAAGFYQPGSRRGTVGQPLPGVAVKVVDPDDFDTELGVDEPGMLIVRGPNVMQGYLGRDDLTAEALRDGWYITGDIAAIDEDGFVRITDRLSRFSKIGGEMVPHGTVEEHLHQAAGSDVQVFAVTGVPDEKKGERLSVLHTLDAEAIPGIVEKLGEMGLPNLFVPRPAQFWQVDALPVLGTGKLDLRGVRRAAMEAEALATRE